MRVKGKQILSLSFTVLRENNTIFRTNKTKSKATNATVHRQALEVLHDVVKSMKQYVSPSEDSWQEGQICSSIV